MATVLGYIVFLGGFLIGTVVVYLTLLKIKLI